MKTKIIKKEGYYRLVVQDEEINQQYDCSNKNPVVLACIAQWGQNNLWSLQDLRLSKHRPPSPYLEESVEEKSFKNEEEKQQIISQLHSYYVDEESQCVLWSKFE